MLEAARGAKEIRTHEGFAEEAVNTQRGSAQI